jgi:hypothetical protein
MNDAQRDPTLIDTRRSPMSIIQASDRFTTVPREQTLAETVTAHSKSTDSVLI